MGQGEDITLVLNINNGLVAGLDEMDEDEDRQMLCEQIYDLAKLAHQPLSAEELPRFVERSGLILARAAKKK